MGFLNYLRSLFFRRSNLPSVIPAQAGIHRCYKALEQADGWIPSFDGMTIKVRGIMVFLMLFFLSTTPVQADSHKDPIKVGWLYSYTAVPHWLERAKAAAEIAVEDFNAQGGLNGRLVELIIRDDRSEPADGLQIVNDLVEREKVDVLAGMSFTTVSKAIYEYAERYKIPYFAGWCDSTVCKKRENGYTFSFEEPYTQTAQKLAREAVTYGIKKWAIVRWNDTWSIAITKHFIDEMKRLDPEVELVTEIAIPFGKAQGNAIIQNLKTNETKGVYLAMVGGDLANYIRAQRQRGEIEKYKHVHAYLPPEELNFLGDEAPVGWYVHGYPGKELKTRDHLAFTQRFEEKTGKNVGLSGIVSYVNMLFVLETLKQAGSVDREKVAQTAPYVSVKTPIGLVSMDPETHVSDFTAWYGYLDLKDGKPVMVNFERGERE
jgi:branched-chain amino acid transport system substrate-binding protein